MTVLVLTGSARSGSFTRALGAQIADATGGSLATGLTELPYFDQDLEATPPAVVEELRAQVAAADALVVVTPEYNGTISGLLGNAIDWLSRPYAGGPSVLRDKPTVAVAASPGPVGGVRALVSLRTVLGNAGVELLDTTLSVGEVHTQLADDGLQLDELVAALTPARQAA
ncbi:MAG: NAD(P)H-dependent oxidoreductase [Actinobacteria bacterium]|nr:NAD(P)H-dependent oxidoreductase [Actinomycetota bacterium]MCA1721535.1 NAD(P)H-dependent oxidoreductase [Actinomycetota bacterium]